MEQSNNDTKLVCESATVAVDHVGAVPEQVGRTTIKTEQAGKLSRIAYFQRLEANRLMPGNCRRCGKSNGNGLSNCDRCRNYHTLYKLRRRNERLIVPSEVAKNLAQFRRELSRLRATIKNMANQRRNSYRKGYSKGLASKRVRLFRSAWIPPRMSKQELATINHAYSQ